MSDEAACSQNMQWAWRTQAPSACSPEPAPRARPGTAPGRTAQRWWRGPATEQPARCQLRSPSGGLRRRGSAHAAPRGNPLCPVCSRAASAAGESGQAHASGRTCMLQAQKSGSNSYIYIRHGYALRCRPCPLRRMQRVPGHHRAHGRSGEPGHHDMAKSHVETVSKARAPAAAHTRSAEPRFASHSYVPPLPTKPRPKRCTVVTPTSQHATRARRAHVHLAPRAAHRAHTRTQHISIFTSRGIECSISSDVPLQPCPALRSTAFYTTPELMTEETVIPTARLHFSFPARGISGGASHHDDDDASLRARSRRRTRQLPGRRRNSAGPLRLSAPARLLARKMVWRPRPSPAPAIRSLPPWR